MLGRRFEPKAPTDFPDEALNSSIDIDDQRIDDPMIVRSAYADFAFPLLLKTNDRSSIGYAFRRGTSQVMANYYNFSYSGRTWELNGHALPMRPESWESALWEIRNACGKDFTDRVLFYMFKQIDIFSSDPKFYRDPQGIFTISQKDFNEYFFGGLLAGDNVIDDNFQKRPLIGSILKAHGLLDKQSELF
jgi:hypothetical protein